MVLDPSRKYFIYPAGHAKHPLVLIIRLLVVDRLVMSDPISEIFEGKKLLPDLPLGDACAPRILRKGVVQSCVPERAGIIAVRPRAKEFRLRWPYS
jgi:hypothetical protein